MRKCVRLRPATWPWPDRLARRRAAQEVPSVGTPDYYKPELSERDLAEMLDITQATAQRFGYTEPGSAVETALA
jgi:hypothetical protein